ncbi:hypothetical protein MJ575_09670 [Klebsiella pneumoniae]|nr:hypothetical protein MJ575_09670 [Klebsiella pneumoniae]
MTTALNQLVSRLNPDPRPRAAVFTSEAAHFRYTRGGLRLHALAGEEVHGMGVDRRP